MSLQSAPVTGNALASNANGVEGDGTLATPLLAEYDEVEEQRQCCSGHVSEQEMDEGAEEEELEEEVSDWLLMK